VARGEDRGRSVEVGDAPVTVGRSSQCDLRLTAAQVSKEHFRVEVEGDDLVLIDLESSFGTQVNGQRTERRVLRDMDRISIGDTVIVFEDRARQ
jgi:pSer/pThr/pTyr-binding forkhead associated (FHA) protein